MPELNVDETGTQVLQPAAIIFSEIEVFCFFFVHIPKSIVRLFHEPYLKRLCGSSEMCLDLYQKLTQSSLIHQVFPAAHTFSF